MSRDVNMPFGVVIVHDELTWGHVQQTVLLQGKVLGDCCGRFRDRLLLTSRSFRILARLKAFSGGLFKIFLVVLSLQKIRKFLEMIFSATRLLGWKVVTKGTLSIVMLFAAWLLFKISALDLVDACSLPLLMRSFGYPRAAKKGLHFGCLDVEVSVVAIDLTQSEKLTIKYG